MDPKDKPKTETAPEANAEPKAKARTIEELLGNADDSLKADIEDAFVAQKAVRDSLITKITANKANAFTPEELGKMSTPQLGKIATLAAVPEAAAPATPKVETAPETETEEETAPPAGNAKPKPTFAGNDAGAAPKPGARLAANQEQPDGSGVPVPPVINWAARSQK